MVFVLRFLDSSLCLVGWWCLIVLIFICSLMLYVFVVWCKIVAWWCGVIVWLVCCKIVVLDFCLVVNLGSL